MYISDFSPDKNESLMDRLIKILPITFTLIGLLFGLYQYNKNNEREFRKVFYIEQLKVYNEIVELAARISLSNVDSLQTKTFQRVEGNFNELYFGKLNLFEDTIVEKSVGEFYVALQRFRTNMDPVVDNELMQRYALIISLSCRQSLQKTFDVNIDELILSFKKTDND